MARTTTSGRAAAKNLRANRHRRVEGLCVFGGGSQIGEFAAVRPQDTQLDVISRPQRNMLGATLHDG